LDRIVDWHNAETRDLDVSIHLNAFDHSAHGVEILYVTQSSLASKVSAAIADAGGFTNRGAKKRTDLAFLNGTEEPAILLECWFCDHTGDCQAADANHDAIAEAIAESISGYEVPDEEQPPELPPEPEEPPVPSEENRLDINTTHTGNMIISLNEQELAVGEPQANPNIVRLTLSTEGDVVVTINGQDWHNYGDTPPDPSQPPAGPTDVPLEDRPTISKGDEGDDVRDMQSLIPDFNGEIDGDFGPTTEAKLTEYQATRGLAADGICGPITWQALYESKPVLPPPPHALSVKEIDDIGEIAMSSDIATYSWKDRGQAPPGYTQGMALAFAQSYRKLKQGHPAAVDMAKARKSSDKDALHIYWEEFNALDMSNETAGTDTLRHLYALMLGHGMRESSGRHCEGRDLSASNVQSDTAEAGLFQTSYNAHSASDPEFGNLMTEYSSSANAATCYLAVFAEGVSCTNDEWGCYGSGEGYAFQELAKECPAFAVETCGLTLRNLANHYGPIIRHETELKPAADNMLRRVQDYIDQAEAVA
jgi:hypothetical protein